MKTTWRQQIVRKMSERGETWNHIIRLNIEDEKELDRPFENDWGGPHVGPFILWTDNYVYFSGEYDGSVNVQSVPRNPSSFKPAFL